jgi:tetratricopeptide (TPR) repeat protein
MRLVLAIAFSLAFVPAVMAAETAAAQPAAPAAPTTTPDAHVAPPVRFDWQGNHKKAQAALAQKDYKTAIQLFTDIINSGRLPKAWVAPTFYLRGKAYRSARQFNEAIADYQKAIETDPAMHMAHYEMGAAYQELNQHAKAVDAFSKAIAVKGDNAGYFYARSCRSWVSKFADATRGCRTATKMSRAMRICSQP